MVEVRQRTLSPRVVVEKQEERRGGGEEGEEKRGEEEEATNIKSNNPHLAGGEHMVLRHARITIIFMSHLGLHVSKTLQITTKRRQSLEKKLRFLRGRYWRRSLFELVFWIPF